MQQRLLEVLVALQVLRRHMTAGGAKQQGLGWLIQHPTQGAVHIGPLAMGITQRHANRGVVQNGFQALLAVLQLPGLAAQQLFAAQALGHVPHLYEALAAIGFGRHRQDVNRMAHALNVRLVGVQRQG